MPLQKNNFHTASASPDPNRSEMRPYASKYSEPTHGGSRAGPRNPYSSPSPQGAPSGPSNTSFDDKGDRAHAEIERLNAEIREYRRREMQWKMERSRLEGQLQARESWRSEFTELQKLKNSLDNAHTLLRFELDETQKRFAEEGESHKACRQEVQRLKTELEARIAAEHTQDEENARLKADAEQLRVNCDTQQQHLHEQKSKIENLTATIREEKEKVASLQGFRNLYETSIQSRNDSQTALRKADNELEKSREHCATLQSDLDNLQSHTNGAFHTRWDKVRKEYFACIASIGLAMHDTIVFHEMWPRGSHTTQIDLMERLRVYLVLEKAEDALAGHDMDLLQASYPEDRLAEFKEEAAKSQRASERFSLASPVSRGIVEEAQDREEDDARAPTAGDGGEDAEHAKAPSDVIGDAAFGETPGTQTDGTAITDSKEDGNEIQTLEGQLHESSEGKDAEARPSDIQGAEEEIERVENSTGQLSSARAGTGTKGVRQVIEGVFKQTMVNHKPHPDP